MLPHPMTFYRDFQHSFKERLTSRPGASPPHTISSWSQSRPKQQVILPIPYCGMGEGPDLRPRPMERLHPGNRGLGPGPVGQNTKEDSALPSLFPGPSRRARSDQARPMQCNGIACACQFTGLRDLDRGADRRSGQEENCFLPKHPGPPAFAESISPTSLWPCQGEHSVPAGECQQRPGCRMIRHTPTQPRKPWCFLCRPAPQRPSCRRWRA